MQYLFLGLGLAISFPLAAEAASLQLLCTLYKSTDGSAEHSVPRRTDLLTVVYSSGEATITSKLHQKQLSGTISDHEISGVWEGPRASVEIYVNRYTSEYRVRAFFDDPARSPATSFGSCQIADEPA
jgi:hypothetical protein